MEKRIYLRDERFYRHMWKMREADWEKISLMTLERATASCRGLCSSRKIPHRAKLPAWMDPRKKSSFFFLLTLRFKLRDWQIAQQHVVLSYRTSTWFLTLVSVSSQPFHSSSRSSEVLFWPQGQCTCTQVVHKHALGHSHITFLRGQIIIADYSSKAEGLGKFVILFCRVVSLWSLSSPRKSDYY